MKRKEIIQKLTTIFENTLNRNDIKEIEENANLFTDLGLDSISILRIVISIEETLKVDFDDADLKKFKCVKDVVDYIETYLNKEK